MPGKSKIYIFAGDHKVAEGEGKIEYNGKLSSAPVPEAWGREDADPMQTMIDAVDSLNLRKKMEMPELTFNVKMSKAEMRRMRRQFMGKKPRLPRKLKKAERHAEFEVFDMKPMVNSSTDPKNVTMQLDIDYRLAIHPAGYPRTKWVHRLVNLWKRKIGQAHRQAIKEMLFKQYLDQHPGMLTYEPDTLGPSPAAKAMVRRGDVTLDTFQSHEMVLDRGQQSKLANMLNQYDKED